MDRHKFMIQIFLKIMIITTIKNKENEEILYIRKKIEVGHDVWVILIIPISKIENK